MLISYISLFSEIYLMFGLFILLIGSIFTSLSKGLYFPNVYLPTLFLTIGIFINSIFIDISVVNFNTLISFDFNKSSAEVIIKTIILLLTCVFFIYTYSYNKNNRFNRFEFILFIYISVYSFTLFILTEDVISFYLLLEIQSICFYILTAYNKYNQYSVESGLKYFILSSFSSMFLLFGFANIYGTTGLLNLTEICNFISTLQNNTDLLLLLSIPITLILLAFFFKLYTAPFHLWVSDIYQGAPTSVTAFFATISTLPLFYVFSKFYIYFFCYIKSYFFQIIIVISILSMLLGMIGALYQKKIKRLMAFSSVSTIGYLLICFINDNPILVANTYVYLLVYIINSIGIFCVFFCLNANKYSIYVERLKLVAKLHRRNLMLALALLFLFFSAAGVPPFSLFFAKVLILTGITYSYNLLILYVLVFAAIVSSFYYLKVVKYISFDSNIGWYHLNKMPYANALFLLYIILFNLLFTIESSAIMNFTDFIVLRFYNTLI